MKVLGVTGGIGSGKTTVCKIFETLQVPVFYSDDVSKSILFSENLIPEIKSLFGDVVFNNGKLDKAQLGSIVFKNKSQLEKLNALLHPRVKEAFDIWKTNQKSPFLIKEAAILFESGSYKSCDFVLTVACSVEERVNRVLRRDRRNRSEIEAIIEKQWTEEQRLDEADFVIDNEKQKLIPQVLRLYTDLVERV